MSNVGLFKAEVDAARKAIGVVADSVKNLKQSPLLKTALNEGEIVMPDITGEATANVMLAYRHLEDARMRLGKAIQAVDGGVSCYDKPPILLPGGPQITPRPTIEELEKMIARGQKFEMNPDGTVSPIPSDTGPTAAQANEVLGKPGHY